MMQKLKKVAAVAVMVGGMGVVGAGVASASNGHSAGEPFPGVAIDTVQVMECEQSFAGGLAFAPVNPATVGGDNSQNFGNFCAQVNVED